MRLYSSWLNGFHIYTGKVGYIRLISWCRVTLMQYINHDADKHNKFTARFNCKLG